MTQKIILTNTEYKKIKDTIEKKYLESGNHSYYEYMNEHFFNIYENKCDFSDEELKKIASRLFYSFAHNKWADETFSNWSVFKKYITEDQKSLIRKDAEQHLYSESDNFISYQFNHRLEEILSSSDLKKMQEDHKNWSDCYFKK
jgi:hypothetical protein